MPLYKHIQGLGRKMRILQTVKSTCIPSLLQEPYIKVGNPVRLNATEQADAKVNADNAEGANCQVHSSAADHSPLVPEQHAKDSYPVGVQANARVRANNAEGANCQVHSPPTDHSPLVPEPHAKDSYPVGVQADARVRANNAEAANCQVHSPPADHSPLVLEPHAKDSYPVAVQVDARANNAEGANCCPPPTIPRCYLVDVQVDARFRANNAEGANCQVHSSPADHSPLVPEPHAKDGYPVAVQVDARANNGGRCELLSADHSPLVPEPHAKDSYPVGVQADARVRANNAEAANCQVHSPPADHSPLVLEPHAKDSYPVAVQVDARANNAEGANCCPPPTIPRWYQNRTLRIAIL
ncbi:hypothetical protein J6590_013003 [Homalodisca vitripennis]|nr:hypothetical protein J6590_013003 [Homalodisca vitripennis]